MDKKPKATNFLAAVLGKAKVEVKNEVDSTVGQLNGTTLIPPKMKVKNEVDSNVAQSTRTTLIPPKIVVKYSPISKLHNVLPSGHVGPSNATSIPMLMANGEEAPTTREVSIGDE